MCSWRNRRGEISCISSHPSRPGDADLRRRRTLLYRTRVARMEGTVTARTTSTLPRQFTHALIFAIAAVCQRGETLVEQPGEVVIRTGRAEYFARFQDDPAAWGPFGFAVVARFENRSKAPVYLDRCGPTSPSPDYAVLSVALHQDGNRSAYTAPNFCFPHDSPVVVEPGESRTDTLHVSGPYVVDNQTGRSFGAREGQFFLSYPGGSCPEIVGCRIPEGIRSNAFQVEVLGEQSRAEIVSDAWR